MRRLTEARLLAQPIDDVFAYLADFSNGPDWDPGVRDARRAESGPVTVGNVFLLNVRFGGQTLPMRYTLLTHEAPHLLVFEGTSKTSRVRDTIWLAPEPTGGTRITWTLELELLGVNRLGEPFVGPALRRLGRVALDGLTTRCARPLFR